MYGDYEIRMQSILARMQSILADRDSLMTEVDRLTKELNTCQTTIYNLSQENIRLKERIKQQGEMLVHLHDPKTYRG